MQNNWEVYQQLILNFKFNSNPMILNKKHLDNSIFVYILLFSKPWPVILDFDFFRLLWPMKSIDWIHTLLSLLLVLILHWGQRLQHRPSGHQGDSDKHNKALWPRWQMGHRASQCGVGSVWVINIRLNSDTSDLSQATSVRGKTNKYKTFYSAPNWNWQNSFQMYQHNLSS